MQSGLTALRAAVDRARVDTDELAAVCRDLLDARVGREDDRALLAVRRAA
jgi:hypothetical protein